MVRNFAGQVYSDRLTITILLLIRHGENNWVTTNRLAGRTPGVHLNERGQQQTQALSQRLAEQPITAVYSSPLERCIETAQPVADALNLPVQITTGMLEADMGEWQGAELKELAKLPEWRTVQQNPSSFRFPAGESFVEMQARAIGALEQIRLAHPQEAVAVFSHSDVIRVCVAHFMGTPLDLFQRIMISTASVSAIAFHDGKPAVLFVNHTAELPKLEIKQPAEAKDEAESTSSN